MPLPSKVKSELRSTFSSIAVDASEYFDSAALVAIEPFKEPLGWTPSASTDHYWEQLPFALRTVANVLITRVLNACAELAGQTGLSPLAGPEDTKEIKLVAKRMRSALSLRKYHYREAEVLHDEGSVLGYRSAEQMDVIGLSPSLAKTEFQLCLPAIDSVISVIEATPSDRNSVGRTTTNEASKYRADTAFIMMWMDPSHPELTDVADCVRSAFRSFGVYAVRADDIEHDGLITERILNEIKTSEFLFADLTGARPNVYYEIGFAHALGKKVILFRKSGTGIHFDLAGYNCPEYENLRDLKDKLTKRLVSVTNKNPREEREI